MKDLFLDQIERICERNPKALILREKELTAETYESLSAEVIRICQKYQVCCILHNFSSVALHLGAENIHVPLRELRLLQNREQFRKIGCSVHTVEEAMEAEFLGAAYLAAGHIYETSCKKGVKPRGLLFLQEVCAHVNIPVYAIGGIGLYDGRVEQVRNYGAAGACIMSGVMKI